MDKFDELANSIADEMYTAEADTEVAEEATETTAEETTTAETPTVEDTEAEAVNTAVAATDMAVQKQEEVTNLSNLLAQEQEKVSRLEALLAQKNAEEEKAMIEEVTKEAPISPPVLDIDAFDSDEVVAQKQKKYAEDYDAYMRAKLNEEYKPMLEWSQKAMKQKEYDDALIHVKGMEEISALGDFDSYTDRIHSMLKNNKSLNESAPLEERMINAYLIAKGYESLKAKEPTVAEIFEKYKDNEEFADLFNKAQIAKVKNAEKVPPFSSTGGASNASPNVKKRPSTFEEAFESTKGLF